jgi:hypothetical protein
MAMTGRLNFEIDSELEPGLITARAGLPSLIEAYRLSGTAAVIERTVKVKTRKRGLGSSEMVESFLALWAAGGERAEDFDHLRQDKALAELIGHELPAAQTARDFSAPFTKTICRCCKTARRRCRPRARRCKDWLQRTRN